MKRAVSMIQKPFTRSLIVNPVAGIETLYRYLSIAHGGKFQSL